MRRSGFAVIGMTLAMMFVSTESALAQLGQLNAGANTGQAAGAGGAGAAAAGGAGQGAGGGDTTQGAGGVTQQGPGQSAAQDGGLAGGNTATTFVGQNQAGGFVGGGVGTQTNNNRQFRAITNAQVPTGGTQATSGTPRSIPTSLRIAFTYPIADASTNLTGPSGPAINQVAMTRPELRAVAVEVDHSGTATLTGSAPDAAARRLAANLVRLRPGIRKVENQILVATE